MFFTNRSKLPRHKEDGALESSEQYEQRLDAIRVKLRDADLFGDRPCGMAAGIAKNDISVSFKRKRIGATDGVHDREDVYYDEQQNNPIDNVVEMDCANDCVVFAAAAEVEPKITTTMCSRVVSNETDGKTKMTENFVTCETAGQQQQSSNGSEFMVDNRGPFCTMIPPRNSTIDVDSCRVIRRPARRIKRS